MKRFTLLLVPLCLAAAGCAGSALRPDDAQQQEVQALKSRIVELQREAAMNQVELAQLRQQMAEMQSRGGSAPRSTTAPAPAPSVRAEPPVVTSPPSRSPSATVTTPPRSTAPAPAAVTPPKSASVPAVRPATPPAAAPQARREPVRPAEPIEEVDIELPEKGPQPPPRHTPPPAAPAPRTSTATTVTPPSTAPKSSPPVTLPAPAPANPVAPPVDAPSPSAGSGEEGAASEMLSPASQALYDRGYTLFHQGHFVDAEASFQRFLQANPKSELADNAQYWIGECRYSRNDVKGALAAFREVTERYPKGNKVPDAMLKSGQCMEAMGDVEGARVTYREVVRRFNGSAAAAVAEERRAKLP